MSAIVTPLLSNSEGQFNIRTNEIICKMLCTLERLLQKLIHILNNDMDSIIGRKLSPCVLLLGPDADHVMRVNCGLPVACEVLSLYTGASGVA